MHAPSRRKGWMLAGGLAAGVVAVAAYLAWPDRMADSGTTFVVPPQAMTQPPPAEPVQAAAVAPAPPATCAFEPVVERAGPQDGQFSLANALALHRSGDPGPFIAVAGEMTSAGRPRDAEVALIAACRVAGQAGAMSAPAADVQTRLARHYAGLARSVPEGPVRDALLERAESLLHQTVQAYGASLGAQASKTRLAQQRLAALHTPAMEPQTASAEPLPSDDTSQRMGAARLSLAERPPAPQDNLQEVDADLERLQAQARAVTRDPAGMQQRTQQAMAQRNACKGDDACLRAWYAQRRRQLFAEF